MPTIVHFEIPTDNVEKSRSVDEYSSKVERLGGKIVLPKMPVKGMGYFAVCLDTENNTFGIWETNSEAK